MFTCRLWSPFLLLNETLIFSRSLKHPPRNFTVSLKSIEEIRRHASDSGNLSATSVEHTTSLSGMEDALMGFISGKRKATEVAHSIWQSVVRKGDTVVDATCGNGHDTLALLKMVADGSGSGRVYGVDIQNSALENTSYLLDKSVNQNERGLVKLFPLCHSKVEDIVPKAIYVRLVVFNLGYLPGGNKEIITMAKTTLLALEAASRILGSGGLISVMVYVGHPGGREEFETVQAFASSLSPESWVCCKFETLNRPTAPILILLFKK